MTLALFRYMDWYIKQQQQQHEQLRQRQIELQHQEQITKQRMRQKHRHQELLGDTKESNNDHSDDLEPDDSISNHAVENEHAETDDDKLRRLSTAERQEELNQLKSDENSTSIEIPVAYDSSSGTELPEADILTIDHPPDNTDIVTKVRPNSAEVLLSTK